jgi:exonuclease SbcC
VDLTVEMEKPSNDDDIDVNISYGEDRYPVELGSGMEKFIASIAIRVALINVSALPKTDMLIIDEGFGSLDPSGIEAACSMLASLKRYFRLIIVITHIESIKDAVDNVIEVVKDAKDARVVYD